MSRNDPGSTVADIHWSESGSESESDRWGWAREAKSWRQSATVTAASEGGWIVGWQQVFLRPQVALCYRYFCDSERK